MINDQVIDRIIDDMLPHLQQKRECCIATPIPLLMTATAWGRV